MENQSCGFSFLLVNASVSRRIGVEKDVVMLSASGQLIASAPRSSTGVVVVEIGAGVRIGVALGYS